MLKPKVTTATLLSALLVGCGNPATLHSAHPTQAPRVFPSGSFPLHDRELGAVRGLFVAVGGLTTASTPVRGTVTLTEAGTGIAYKLTTAADGAFGATVSAGTYNATGLTSQYVVNNREGECRAEAPVVVPIGHTVKATVECQRK